MKYDLVRPCPHCPFRTDIPGYLRPERARQIARDVASGAEFPCHQTTEHDDDGDAHAVADSQMCAGATIAMMKGGGPNQILRIAERVGMWDPEKMDLDAPVGSLLDMCRNHEDPEEEQEPCHISDYGCLAPAGYLVDGQVVTADAEGETFSCYSCGEYVCESCSEMRTEDGNDVIVCASCVEWENEAKERADADRRVD